MTEACPIHPRREFIASPGCSENLTLLAGVMKMSKAKKRSLGVVFINFAKVFDTVSRAPTSSGAQGPGSAHAGVYRELLQIMCYANKMSRRQNF